MEESDIPITWLRKGDLVTGGSWGGGMIEYPCLVLSREVVYSASLGGVKRTITSVTLVDSTGKQLTVNTGYSCDAIRRGT